MSTTPQSKPFRPKRNRAAKRTTVSPKGEGAPKRAPKRPVSEEGGPERWSVYALSTGATAFEVAAVFDVGQPQRGTLELHPAQPRHAHDLTWDEGDDAVDALLGRLQALLTEATAGDETPGAWEIALAPLDPATEIPAASSLKFDALTKVPGVRFVNLDLGELDDAPDDDDEES